MKKENKVTWSDFLGVDIGLTENTCLAKVNPELAKEWNYEKNEDFTPFDVTCGSNKKVWWVCKNGHEWESQVSNRNAGNGCPYCCGRLANSNNNLAIVHPYLLDEWDYEKNSKSPENYTPRSGKKVWWICKNGHEWESVIGNRSKGIGCPVCSNKVLHDENCLAKVNPELAKQWHPTKNGKLTPFNIVASSHEKVWWKCEKGHEWESQIGNLNRPRTNSNGCPYCSGQSVNHENCLAKVNPELAKEWHPTKNGDLTPFDVTCGSNKKVWWICKNGHEWKVGINGRHGKNNDFFGCRKCHSVFSEYTDAKNYIKKHNISTGREFLDKHHLFNIKIPRNPADFYENEWEGWAIFLNNGKGSKCVSPISFIECKQFVQKLNLSGQKEWQNYSKSGKRPINIPSDPSRRYKREGWKGWKDFLGN